MSFVTHASNKDASAFKALVEETLAEKVVLVLEGLKIEVASHLFGEEGGVSGGVASVKKKPAPPAAGTVSLPGQGGKTGGLEHAGRSNKSGGEKSGDAVLPGQKNEETKIDEGATSYKAPKGYSPRREAERKLVKKGAGGSPEKEPEGDRVKAVQKDKKPHLSSKPKKDGVEWKERMHRGGRDSGE